MCVHLMHATTPCHLAQQYRSLVKSDAYSWGHVCTLFFKQNLGLDVSCPLEEKKCDFDDFVTSQAFSNLV